MNISYMAIPDLNISVLEFIDNSCNISGVKRVDVISKKRNREFTDVRHLICYFLMQKLDNSVKTARFMNLDHASVLHAVKKTNNLIIKDKNFRQKYELIKTLI